MLKYFCWGSQTIILVNDHFQRVRIFKTGRSFWWTIILVCQNFPRRINHFQRIAPEVPRRWNTTTLVFSEVNNVVPTRSLHQTITWSTGNQLEGSGPKFMSLSSSLLSKLITRSNRKQIGANWLRLQRMLRLHTTHPNTERIHFLTMHPSTVQ